MTEPFAVSSSGSVRTSLVDRSIVRSCVETADSYNLFVTVAVAAAVAAVSLGAALAAGLVHPIPTYILLGGTGFTAVIVGLLAKREWGRMRERRRLLDAGESILIAIQPTSATAQPAPDFAPVAPRTAAFIEGAAVTQSAAAASVDWSAPGEQSPGA